MEQYKKILGKVMMTAEGTYNKDKKYEPISLVTDEETNKSYISRKEVPAGTQINNREYWQPVASSGIIDNGVIILNRKNNDGQIPIYDLKSATEAVAVGDRKGGVILGFLGFNPEIDTVPTWKLYQYNDVSPSNWTNIDYWLPMDYTNKYAGWFDNEKALYNSVPFPKVGMYAYVGNSVSSAVVYRCYNDRVWQPTEDKAFSGVVNLADEEDITSKQNKLKFKDKEYNPAQYNGLGRIYLRKNMIDGKNILTQEMIEATNTIYIIQYDYNLQGQTITIPENCIFDFQGGSFSNGVISGNNTNLIVNRDGVFNNVLFLGIFKTTIAKSSWFIGDDRYILKNLSIIYSDIIELENRTYELNFISITDRRGLEVNSNTIVNGNGAILKVSSNDLTNYEVIDIRNKENIKLNDITIIGDVETHTGTTGEWGMGVSIIDSKNISLFNVNANYCWGDGIYIAASDNSIVGGANINIESCKAQYNRRGALSINSGEYIYVNNCDFSYTGKIKKTPPACAITFEPNNKNQIAKHIYISNCTILNTSSSWIQFAYGQYEEQNNLEDIKISNCYADSPLHLIGGKNIEIKSCYFSYIYKTTNPNAENLITNFKISDCILYEQKESNLVNSNIIRENNKYKADFSNKLRRIISLNSNISIRFPLYRGTLSIKIFGLWRNRKNYEYKQYDYFIDVVEKKAVLSGYNLFTGSDLKGNILNFYEYLSNDRIRLSTPIVENDFVTIYACTTPTLNNTAFIEIEYQDISDFQSTSSDITNNSFEFEEVSDLTNSLLFSEGDTANTIFSKLFSVPNKFLYFKDTNELSVVGNYLKDTDSGIFAFNKSLNKPIWWTGTKWVDANGAEV